MTPLRLSESRTVLQPIGKCIIVSEGKKNADGLGITISTDGNKELARAYSDAGCIWVQQRQFLACGFLDFFAIGSCYLIEDLGGNMGRKLN